MQKQRKSSREPSSVIKRIPSSSRREEQLDTHLWAVLQERRTPPLPGGRCCYVLSTSTKTPDCFESEHWWLMSPNLSSCSPMRVLLSHVLWGSGARQSWVQKQRVKMLYSFITDWRDAGSCWEHTLLRTGVGHGARTGCFTGTSEGTGLVRQAQVRSPGLQTAVPGTALGTRPAAPTLDCGVVGTVSAHGPPRWGAGAAVLQEELWCQVAGVRPQHTAPGEPVRETTHKEKKVRLYHSHLSPWKLLMGFAGDKPLLCLLSCSSFPGDAEGRSCIFCCSLFSRVQLFATPWTAACQASLSITISLSLLKLMSIQSMMPSNHLILCCPLLFLPSIFPSFLSVGVWVWVWVCSFLHLRVEKQTSSATFRCV